MRAPPTRVQSATIQNNYCSRLLSKKISPPVVVWLFYSTVAFFKNKPWMKMRLQISKQAYKHQSRLLQGGSDQDYFILDRKVFDGNRRVVDNRKFLFCLVVSRAKILKLRVVDNTDIYFVE
jgi:hypothetical protein